MKGNNGKRRIGWSWLSVLLIVAMLTPMFSAIALAEEYEEEAPVFEAEYEQEYVEPVMEAEPDMPSYEEPAPQPETFEAFESEVEEDTTYADEGETTADDGEAMSGEGDPTTDDGEDEASTDDGEGVLEEAVEEFETGFEDTADAFEAEERIVGSAIDIFDFDALSKNYYAFVAKPTKADFIKMLPTTLDAVLSDGTPVKKLPVRWKCEDDFLFDSEDYGEFIFVAELTEDAEYVLNDATKAPQVTLYVAYISEVKIEGSDTYYSEYRPETADMAADDLNFPINAIVTLKTSEDEQNDIELYMPVEWVCDNYEEGEKEYTFTAQFNPAPKFQLDDAKEETILIGDDVEMPQIYLNVVSDFIVKIDKEKNIAIITDWNGASDTLYVPDNIAGYPVEEIAEGAFSNHPEMMVVELPETVKKIGANAFSGCSNLTFVTLTDSLTDVADSAFNNTSSDLSITLEVNGSGTTLSGQNQFKHDSHTVTLTNREIGSLVVNGNLTVEAMFTVDDGNNYNRIEVKSGGTLTLEKGYRIYNKSDIIVEGTFVNNGEVYGCFTGKSVDGIDKYITTHTDPDNTGVCQICGARFGKSEKKLSVKTLVSLEKDYDGKNTANLAKDSFELDKTNVDEADLEKEINFDIVSATYDSAEVGDRVVTVKFKVDTADDCVYNYVLDDFTAQGKIRQVDLSTSASINAIPDQKYIDKALEPEVTVRMNDGRILKNGEEYTVTYANNDKAGTATVTVTGRGNYTGTLTQNFTIAKVEKLTLTFTGEKKPSKSYDGKNDIPLQVSDFTLKGADETVKINGVTGTLDSVTVGGNHTVTVVAELSPDGYVAECTISGVSVTARDISKDPVKLAAIADQKETGKEVTPGVELTFNDKALVENRDYTLKYENNTKVGTAKVTVTGCGNFTGERSAEFKIVAAGEKKTKKLTASLIGEKDKIYDGTTNSKLTVSDFVLETGGIEDEDAGRVKIASVKAYYDNKNAGTRRLMVSFTLDQASATYNYVVDPIRYDDAEIVPRTLTVYPLRGQYKIYGTRDPIYYNALENGLLEGDTVDGVMEREEGEDRGFYDYTVDNIDAGNNYEVVLAGELDEDEDEDAEADESEDEDEDESTSLVKFEIRPKNLASADITVKFDEEVYRTSDGNEVKPELTIVYHSYYGDLELEEGTDYEVKFTDNTKRGTGHAIITAVNSEECNYTGARVEDFRIKKEHSGGGSSSSYTEEDDEEEEEEEEEDVEPKVGELWIDLDDGSTLKVGYILFGQDNRPRPFEYNTEDIEQTATDDAVDALEDAGIAPVQTYPLDANGMPILPKRLIITPDPLSGADGMPVPLSSDNSREMYEWLQLRLTPEQVNLLRGEHFEELVYTIENTEMHVPLDVLTYDIDIAPLKKNEAQETVAGSDEDFSSEEDFSDEESGGEEAEFEESLDEDTEDADAEVATADNLLLAPEMVRVTSYVFTIEQVENQNLSGREMKAMEGYVSLLPLYRGSMNAVNGELPAILTDPDGETDTVVDYGYQGPEPTYYPLLEAWTDVEIRVNEGLTLPTDDYVYEMPKSAQMLVVSDNAEMSDEDAIERTTAEYINDEANGLDYARFAGVKNGLHTLVLEEGWTEEDEYAEEEDEDFEDIEDVPEEETEIEPEEEPVEIEPEIEEEEETLVEDPDPVYAYSRKSNGGDQYWLIDTQNKTVEYYRGDTNVYMIGDYTGSLMSGMEVTFRTEPPETTTIQLKFKQTYKFAMMDDAGVSLLMEQDDVATIQSTMSNYRQ